MHPKHAGIFLLVSTSLALSSCQSASAPGVSNGVMSSDIAVNFQDSANFKDVRDTPGGPTVPAHLDVLALHLKERAPAFLQYGQRLTVTFTDIDLAGDFPPRPPVGGNDIRIIKTSYPPRMKLYFAVHTAKGRLIKDGTRVLQDLNFQTSTADVMSSKSEPLFFFKKILTDWLDDEFPAPPPSRRYSEDGVGLGSSHGSEPWLQGATTNRGAVEDFHKK
jgi:hypothetical protein